MPFLHTFSLTIQVLLQKFEKVPKTTQNVPKSINQSIVTIIYGFWIPIVFILALKRPNKMHFRIRNLVPPTTKTRF